MLDQIRAATVGSAKQFRREKVTVNGVEIEVRQPSIRERARILKASKAQTGDQEKIDLGELFVTAAIACCYDPGTSQKVFTDADRESLMEQPSGSFVDDLGAVALKLMNVDEEELRKNSERTESGKPASP